MSIKCLRFINEPIDEIDRRLLEALNADARQSVADLARLVGLSAPSVSERIRRLEEAGVVEGYTIKLNPPALGLTLAAWLRVRPLPGQLETVAGILRSLPQVTQCDRITGEDCFLAKVHVRSIAELEKLIDKIIPHAMTNTSIIQSSPVAPRLPPIGRS